VCGVLVDRRMTFVNHIESIVLKSARMLGFIWSLVTLTQDVVCGFYSAGFGVCIVRVVASSRGYFGEN
jgi:hypothetical protein